MRERVVPALLCLMLLIGTSGCGEDELDGRLTGLGRDGQPRWEVDTSHPLVASAAPAGDGLVLVWARDRCDGPVYLEAVDAGTGARAWEAGPVETDGPSRVEAEGSIVVGVDGDDVIAWNLTTGAQRWRKRTTGEIDSWVAAGDDGVVTSTTDRPHGAATVVERDPSAGTMRWSVELEAGRQVIDLAMTDDEVLLRTWGPTSGMDVPTTEVEALSRVDGTRRWRIDLGISELAVPLEVAGDVVLVGMTTIAWHVGGEVESVDRGPSSSIVALSIDDGAIEWRIDRDGESPPTAWPTEGIRLHDADRSTALLSDEQGLVAVTAASGTPRWRIGMTVGDAWLVAGAVIASELVPFDESSFTTRVIDPRTGDVGWTYESDRPVVAAAGTEGGLVLVQRGTGGGCSD